MYTIKEAAARTGLTVPVLRAWERRYAVVAPARTSGGYRVYDDAALGRLRSMRRLVDDGWSPSAAAAAIKAGTAPVEDFESHPVERQPGRLVGQLVDGAAAIDSPRIERVLDEMFAGGTYERVVDDQLIPGLHALGDAWAEGRVSVAGEHVASNAILRRLAASFQASGPGRDPRRPVLVGMAPGAHHELGGLIFATALRRAGLPVVYFGADLPLEDWVAAIERNDARAVVVGAVMPTDTAQAMSVANAVRAAQPDVLIAFGGPAAPDPETEASSDAQVIRLPADLGKAVATLASALPRTTGGRRSAKHRHGRVAGGQ
jgi:DNA-binding transcriptional MerR regulator/methylmalonyl-CoA mutase cobalamin-binding subunit